MTSRTVMAARLRPASPRSGPRSVYVCIPDTLTSASRLQLDQVLVEVVRPQDRLLFRSDPPASGVDPVAAFAASHGHRVDPIETEPLVPDVIVIILDPLGDNSSALQARTLANYGDSDLVITELPELG